MVKVPVQTRVVSCTDVRTYVCTVLLAELITSREEEYIGHFKALVYCNKNGKDNAMHIHTFNQFYIM